MITAFRASMVGTAVAMLGLAAGCSSMDSSAASMDALHADSSASLNSLYEKDKAASAISRNAYAVLVFPSIVKAGLGVGGAYGQGELRRNGATVDRYSSFTGSWGLQAGAQSYSYVVFLMNKDSVDYLNRSDGWEVGVGPTIVVVDSGKSANLSTTTLQDDAYAFIYDQQGLMAGVSIEGTKITRLK